MPPAWHGIRCTSKPWRVEPSPAKIWDIPSEQPGAGSIGISKQLPFEQLNTNKGTGIGTFGMRDAKIIVPGDPYRSVLMYRMSKLGYARMPYIGSRVVDSEGVALIEQWILSLGNAKENQHSTQVLNSTEDALALALQLQQDQRDGGT